MDAALTATELDSEVETIVAGLGEAVGTPWEVAVVATTGVLDWISAAMTGVVPVEDADVITVVIVEVLVMMAVDWTSAA